MLAFDNILLGVCADATTWLARVWPPSGTPADQRRKHSCDASLLQSTIQIHQFSIN